MLKTGTRGSGPRGRGNAKQTHNRGGIQKSRSSPAPRLDKDGDIDMSASSRGRAQRSGRGGMTHTKAASQQDRRKSGRASKNPFDNINKLQKQIAQAVDTGGAVVRRGEQQKREQVHVRGWDKSKAASNQKECIESLRQFLQRKAANKGDDGKQTSVDLRDTKRVGDTLIIYARPADVDPLLRLNGFTFAGATLSIELGNSSAKQSAPSKNPSNEQSSNESDMTGNELKDRMKSMLLRRYNGDLKLLDLSALGTDPEFASTGMFSTKARQEKFVAALMKVAQQEFKTTAQKREAITSISLASNNLQSVSAVTSVAQTFPDILNLDLSNNEFKTTGALRAWNRRFKNLDLLILSGNPMETQQPNYHADVIKWFRTLRTLNDVQVRTEEEAAKSRQQTRVAPVIAPPHFPDINMIGENFIKHFFPLFDTDRIALAYGLYDSESTFSLNVNTKAPRSDDWQSVQWGDYIKKSRNLTKITTLPARLARIHKGPANISKFWSELPTTRHPDLINESQHYCIECHAQTNLPDPTGQSLTGVDGLMLMVHGQYAEIDTSGQITGMRSFDRTFVIGPGGGVGGIRVLSDICTVRPFGGYDAWQTSGIAAPVDTTQAMVPDQQPQVAAVPAPAVGLGLPDGFAQPALDKSDEQLQKEILTLQLSQATRLTLKYAVMCLENAEWNAETAMVSFEQVKGTLPAEAFI